MMDLQEALSYRVGWDGKVGVGVGAMTASTGQMAGMLIREPGKGPLGNLPSGLAD